MYKIKSMIVLAIATTVLFSSKVDGRTRETTELPDNCILQFEKRIYDDTYCRRYLLKFMFALPEDSEQRQEIFKYIDDLRNQRPPRPTSSNSTDSTSEETPEQIIVERPQPTVDEDKVESQGDASAQPDSSSTTSSTVVQRPPDSSIDQLSDYLNGPSLNGQQVSRPLSSNGGAIPATQATQIPEENKSQQHQDQSLQEIAPVGTKREFFELSTMELIILLAVSSFFCIISVAICFIFRSYWHRQDLQLQNEMHKIPNNSMNESINVMPTGQISGGQNQKVVMVMMNPEQQQKQQAGKDIENSNHVLQQQMYSPQKSDNVQNQINMTTQINNSPAQLLQNMSPEQIQQYQIQQMQQLQKQQKHMVLAKPQQKPANTIRQDQNNKNLVPQQTASPVEITAANSKLQPAVQKKKKQHPRSSSRIFQPQNELAQNDKQNQQQFGLDQSQIKCII